MAKKNYTKPMLRVNETPISDDDFTDEELAAIYGIDINHQSLISCEDDKIEHELDGQY